MHAQRPGCVVRKPFIFMLPIAIADVGVVGVWSMRVENSYIHESPLIVSTPETVHCAMSSLAPSVELFEVV